MYEVFGQAERTAIETEAVDPRESTRVRQATAFVTQEAGDVIREAYRVVGTSGLRNGPLQRCFRDIHAGTQHFFASPAATLEMGRDLMASAPDRAIDA